MEEQEFKAIYNKVWGELQREFFNFSFKEHDNKYFPTYLKACLDSWIQIFDKKLIPIVQDLKPVGINADKITAVQVEAFCDAIISSINLYYQGKISEAFSCFSSALDSLLFLGIKPIREIIPGTNFYRARQSQEISLESKDLFHVPFDKRNYVSTNRYSIPGFPALYVGDSTYVCWEELNKSRLRDLFFSRLSSDNVLNVVCIERFDDFLLSIYDFNPMKKLTELVKHVLICPLIIACTRRVREHNTSFKPEYIIPQFLLEYITKNTSIDGIKYPSSKVDYASIEGVKAHNFVFPVKSNLQEGHCSVLKSVFKISEPISIEQQDIFRPRMFSISNPSKVTGGNFLMLHTPAPYFETQFGRLENVLETMQVNNLH